MKVLKALGRMLLYIGKFLLYILLIVGVVSAFTGLVYCAQERHEIVANVILWILSGTSVLFVGAWIIIGVYMWFTRHYH